MNALQRLQARHKKSAPVKDLAALTKPKLGEAGVVTESCVGKNLGLADLLNKTKVLNVAVDVVGEKIKAREAEGLYTAPQELEDLDGADAGEIMNKLRELDYALIAKTPDIGLLSIKIRQSLNKYVELTHILSDEQLGIICSGALTVANIATAPKTKAAKSASATREIKDLAETISASDI